MVIERVQSQEGGWQYLVHKKSFFGFKLHLLVDSQYELFLAYVLTAADQTDNIIAMEVMEKFGQDTPELLELAKHLSANRGYDDQKLVEYLAKKEITAIIDTVKYGKGTRSLFLIWIMLLTPRRKRSAAVPQPQKDARCSYVIL